MVLCVQIAPPDFDRMFGALADHTRRDIVRRAINAEEGASVETAVRTMFLTSRAAPGGHLAGPQGGPTSRPAAYRPPPGHPGAPKSKINTDIRTRFSPRHVSDEILTVP
jgi:hypothetical protein